MADYGVRGQRFRESSRTKSRREAQRMLRSRIGDREAGKLVGNPDGVTMQELLELHARSYELNGRRSSKRIAQHWRHLESFFGKGSRVLSLTPVRVDDYRADRMKDRAAAQTVNNEVASLRRGFKLAIEKGLLATMPLLRLPKVRNQRQGFFTSGDLAALLLHLPPWAAPAVHFLALTG